MKVGIHVDQLWASAPGGIGAYTRELVQALAELDDGPEIVLFHSTFPQGVPEAWLDDFQRVVVPGGIATLYPRWNLTARPRLPQALGDCDVIHAPLHAAIPPVGSGQRLVVTVHDLAFMVTPEAFPARWRTMYRLGLRAAVARADALIAPSTQTAEDLASRTGIDPSRVRVVAEASSLAFSDSDPPAVAERLGLPRPYLLFVGTLEPRKNLVNLVRAYRKAAEGGLAHALVLAGGKGWRTEELDRELALSGPGTVVVTGRLDAPDLDAVYRGASAFAYVSTYEGFGLPVLEAMERGVPVVTSKTSSLPEVAGDAAVLVDPDSVPALADALRRVLTDEELAGTLSRAGLERAAGFSWERTARLTMEVYGDR